MNTQNLLEQINEATCVINAHGRLLDVNNRFCRMFGFEQGEAEWHYMSDLYRHSSEWKVFSESALDANEQRHFVARLRNRKGRSFKCRITRMAQVSSEGNLIFENRIAKIETPRDAILPAEQLRPVARQVFLTACSDCRRVQDGNGNWVEAAAATSLVRHSQRPQYCPQCAQRLFPGVFNAPESIESFDDDFVAMVR